MTEHDDFTAVRNKQFMDGIKRRAYMLAFPGELIPPLDTLFVEVRYIPYEYAVGYHDAEPEELALYVGRMDAPGDSTQVRIEHEDLADFLTEFFGVGE